MRGRALKIVTDCDIQSIPQICKSIVDVCTTEFPSADFYEIELCISEILGNIVEHGKNIKDGHIDIFIEFGGQDICIEIHDNGERLEKNVEDYINSSNISPFEVDEDHIESVPERGRGLAIVKALMDSFTYIYLDQKNLYTLIKCIN